MCQFSQLQPTVLLIILLHAGAIMVEANLICDYLTVYLEYFTHQSNVLTRRTSTQELKWKSVP
jgi:hypothetical protein